MNANFDFRRMMNIAVSMGRRTTMNRAASRAALVRLILSCRDEATKDQRFAIRQVIDVAKGRPYRRG